jgi:hypothetical protein
LRNRLLGVSGATKRVKTPAFVPTERARSPDPTESDVLFREGGEQVHLHALVGAIHGKETVHEIQELGDGCLGERVETLHFLSGETGRKGRNTSSFAATAEKKGTSP